MKQSRFTASQIMAILKQVENGLSFSDVCREYGISIVNQRTNVLQMAIQVWQHEPIGGITPKMKLAMAT